MEDHVVHLDKADIIRDLGLFSCTFEQFISHEVKEDIAHTRVDGVN